MKSIYKKVLIFLLLGILISGCENKTDGAEQAAAPTDSEKTVVVSEASTDKVNGASDNVQNKDQITVTTLVYEESEPGVDPYKTRMLISDRYIRIDDGPGSADFVLYDNEKKRIFSVLSENEQILVVDPLNEYQSPPETLKLREEKVEDENIPSIAGKKAEYFKFYADQQLCYHVVAVQGLLPEISSIMLEYQQVLAAQQQEILDATPVELQTPCFLMNYLYAPATYMSKGFPVRQWDVGGYRRSLEDVQQRIQVDAKLFGLPQSYSFFSMGINSGAPI